MPKLTLARIAQLERHRTANTTIEHYSTRVTGSSPVRGNFLLNSFLLLYNSDKIARMIYFGEYSNV